MFPNLLNRGLNAELVSSVRALCPLVVLATPDPGAAQAAFMDSFGAFRRDFMVRAYDGHETSWRWLFHEKPDTTAYLTMFHFPSEQEVQAIYRNFERPDHNHIAVVVVFMDTLDVPRGLPLALGACADTPCINRSDTKYTLDLKPFTRDTFDLWVKESRLCVEVSVFSALEGLCRDQASAQYVFARALCQHVKEIKQNTGGKDLIDGEIVDDGTTYPHPTYPHPDHTLFPMRADWIREEHEHLVKIRGQLGILPV